MPRGKKPSIHYYARPLDPVTRSAVFGNIGSMIVVQVGPRDLLTFPA